jgi:putative acetyltransferase
LKQPVFRRAKDADGPAIASLIAAIFAEYDGVLFLLEEFPELSAPASHFDGQGGALWVLDDGGDIVGTIATSPAGPEQWELFKFYLARDLRGRGLADLLLTTALSFARDAGACSICLWSDTRFQAAHRFYEKNGFLRTGDIRALNDASQTREFFFTRRL